MLTKGYYIIQLAFPVREDYQNIFYVIYSLVYWQWNKHFIDNFIDKFIAGLVDLNHFSYARIRVMC